MHPAIRIFRPENSFIKFHLYFIIFKISFNSCHRRFTFHCYHKIIDKEDNGCIYSLVCMAIGLRLKNIFSLHSTDVPVGFFYCAKIPERHSLSQGPLRADMVFPFTSKVISSLHQTRGDPACRALPGQRSPHAGQTSRGLLWTPLPLCFPTLCNSFSQTGAPRCSPD